MFSNRQKINRKKLKLNNTFYIFFKLTSKKDLKGEKKKEKTKSVKKNNNKHLKTLTLEYVTPNSCERSHFPR